MGETDKSEKIMLKITKTKFIFNICFQSLLSVHLPHHQAVNRHFCQILVSQTHVAALHVALHTVHRSKCDTKVSVAQLSALYIVIALCLVRRCRAFGLAPHPAHGEGA